MAIVLGCSFSCTCLHETDNDFFASAKADDKRVTSFSRLSVSAFSWPYVTGLCVAESSSILVIYLLLSINCWYFSFRLSSPYFSIVVFIRCWLRSDRFLRRSWFSYMAILRDGYWFE